MTEENGFGLAPLKAQGASLPFDPLYTGPRDKEPDIAPSAPVTVAMLIDRLSKFPGGMRVVLDGYEGGVCDVTKLRCVCIKLDCNNNSSIYGRHEIVGASGTGFYNDLTTDETAVYIERE